MLDMRKNSMCFDGQGEKKNLLKKNIYIPLRLNASYVSGFIRCLLSAGHSFSPVNCPNTLGGRNYITTEEELRPREAKHLAGASQLPALRRGPAGWHPRARPHAHGLAGSSPRGRSQESPLFLGPPPAANMASPMPPPAAPQSHPPDLSSKPLLTRLP